MKKVFITVLLVFCLLTSGYCSVREDIMDLQNRISSQLNTMFRSLEKYMQAKDENGIDYPVAYRNNYKTIYLKAFIKYIDLTIQLNNLIAKNVEEYKVIISTK